MVELGRVRQGPLLFFLSLFRMLAAIGSSAELGGIYFSFILAFERHGQETAGVDPRVDSLSQLRFESLRIPLLAYAPLLLTQPEGQPSFVRAVGNSCRALRREQVSRSARGGYLSFAR